MVVPDIRTSSVTSWWYTFCTSMLLLSLNSTESLHSQAQSWQMLRAKWQLCCYVVIDGLHWRNSNSAAALTLFLFWGMQESLHRVISVTLGLSYMIFSNMRTKPLAMSFSLHPLKVSGQSIPQHCYHCSEQSDDIRWGGPLLLVTGWQVPLNNSVFMSSMIEIVHLCDSLSVAAAVSECFHWM